MIKQKGLGSYGTKPFLLSAKFTEFGTWRAYQNVYWPTEYLIDANGVIRHTHFGEGGYEETEKAIQQLLTEAGEEASNTPVN